MCEPLSLATIGLSVGQAGMSIVGQQQQRKAQIEYQQAQAEARNEQIIQNRTMATNAFLHQLEAENMMRSQEEQALAEKGHDLSIATMQAKGTAKAAAADAGVGGASLDHLLDDFNRQESMMLGRLELNQQFSEQARVSRETGYGNTWKQRVTSIQPFNPSPVAQVDYLSPILGIGTAGLKVADKNGIFTKPKVADAPSATPFRFPKADSNFFG
jgi:hypothetical protein